MQYDQFVRERITELRLQKRVSEYRMSLDLGHSTSYIRSITSGKALPSMNEFLYICEYLEVSPKAFFDIDMTAPAQISELVEIATKLDRKDLDMLTALAARLVNEK